MSINLANLTLDTPIAGGALITVTSGTLNPQDLSVRNLSGTLNVIGKNSKVEDLSMTVHEEGIVIDGNFQIDNISGTITQFFDWDQAIAMVEPLLYQALTNRSLLQRSIDYAYSLLSKPLVQSLIIKYLPSRFIGAIRANPALLDLIQRISPKAIRMLGELPINADTDQILEVIDNIFSSLNLRNGLE